MICKKSSIVGFAFLMRKESTSMNTSCMCVHVCVCVRVRTGTHCSTLDTKMFSIYLRANTPLFHCWFVERIRRAIMPCSLSQFFISSETNLDSKALTDSANANLEIARLE